MEITSIDTEFIRLDALLKLASAVEAGDHAKLAAQNGEVLINGEVCTIHGKKMCGDDQVECQRDIYEVRTL